MNELIIRASKEKPRVVSQTAMACDWHPVKDYLWRLVGFLIKQRISEIEKKLSGNSAFLPLLADCACQAALTRSIFQDNISYWGFDIERRRLEKAASLYHKDKYVLADLTRPLASQLAGKFDFVVSLNTICHIPLDQKDKFIQNLIYLSNEASTILINCELGLTSLRAFKSLASNFRSIDIYYFDSFLSNTHNWLYGNTISDSTTQQYEESLPNLGALHKQCLFVATNKISKGEQFNSYNTPPPYRHRRYIP